MHMSRLYVLILCFCLTQAIDGQTILSRVTFPIDIDQTTSDLAKAGIDLSHGHGKSGISFTTDLEDYELARLDQSGFRYTVDIPDLSKHRHQIQAQGRTQLLSCQDNLYDNVV